MEVVHKAPRARLRIIMERSFSRFKGQEIQQFLRELSCISGCPTSEITNITTRRGCVIFEADIDENAAKQLIDAFVSAQNPDSSQRIDLRDLKEFIEANSIANINAVYDVKLQVVKKNKSATRKIVLVHGWRGRPEDFGALPEMLSDSVKCPTIGYQYPAELFTGNPSLVYVARNLDNWIRNLEDADRLAFVAHSYGGLVVRKLMVLQEGRSRRLDSLAKQITFVASPHNGAALANIGKYIPFVKSAQVRELAEDSEVLFELNECWQRWANRNVPVRCSVRSIFGTEDKVVPAASARGLDEEAVPILGKGHGDIICPTAPTDDVPLTIVRFLKESAFLS